MSALLDTAPTKISMIAVMMSGVVSTGGSATMTAIDVVPVCTIKMMMPTSIASPPNVVTSSACSAAPRLSRRPVRCPMSRYDSTLVASQNTNIKMMSSAVTNPNITPANVSRSAANRPRPGSESLKYQVQYNNTSAPTTLTSIAMAHASASMRKSSPIPSVGIHSIVSTATSPPSTAGPCSAVHTAVAAGNTAMTANALRPHRLTRYGVTNAPPMKSSSSNVIALLAGRGQAQGESLAAAKSARPRRNNGGLLSSAQCSWRFTCQLRPRNSIRLWRTNFARVRQSDNTYSPR